MRHSGFSTYEAWGREEEVGFNSSFFLFFDLCVFMFTHLSLSLPMLLLVNVVDGDFSSGNRDRYGSYSSFNSGT